MSAKLLSDAVHRFADATSTLTEPHLNNTCWADGAYDGVRYAFLHTTLELRQLSSRLLVERTAHGPVYTAAQHALAQHHAAFRDFEALLIGVDTESYQ